MNRRAREGAGYAATEKGRRFTPSVRWRHATDPRRVSRTGFAAPHLEGGRHAHQRPIVVGEPAQLGDDDVHLVVGDQPGAHRRLPYVFHRNLSHPLAIAVSEGGHDQPDARLHQPGLQRQSKQARPDRRVTSLLRPGDGLVDLHVAGEGGVGRVADVAGEENVL